MDNYFNSDIKVVFIYIGNKLLSINNLNCLYYDENRNLGIFEYNGNKYEIPMSKDEFEKVICYINNLVYGVFRISIEGV